MAQQPHSRLPRLVDGIDLRSLPIGPAEAFVLSRVDGMASEFEIAEAAGLELSAVEGTLEELARLGAVHFRERSVNELNRSPRPAPRPSGPVRMMPIVEAAGSSEPHHPAAALYDPKEIDEAVDIPVERKHTILEAFYRLDSVTHYQVLHVDPSADKRAIKNAYYEIVNVFHPDRYFGKSLGSFKLKLERVFARLTEAHDVLTRAAPRAEYDAYLASLNKTRELDQKLSDSTVQAQVQAIKLQIEQEARAALALGSLSPGADSTPAGHSLSPSTPSIPIASPLATPSMAPSETPRVPSQRPLDAEARKRALARKLGGARTFSGSIPAQAPSSSPSPSPSLAPARSGTSDRAAEELKRRYEQRLVHAREQQAERYLVNARQALGAKDPVSAANALRIAASLVPDNPEITARLLDAQTEAEALLSNHYLTQAQYEEREGRMPEAARSYARATVGNPSARVFERAAYCGLMAASDLRLAGEHARRAVALATPSEEGQSRVTLARIYVTAGMKQSALAEFERAATLAPKDDTIRDWIRRLKRGEA